MFKPLLAAEVAPVDLDLKGLTEDAEDAVVGVQRSIDDWGDESFRIVLDECMRT